MKTDAPYVVVSGDVRYTKPIMRMKPDRKYYYVNLSEPTAQAILELYGLKVEKRMKSFAALAI